MGIRRLPRWIRLIVGPVLLIGLAMLLDTDQVWSRLRGLRPGWVAAAFLLAVAQTVLSAWRWRYTAGRLDLRLPLRRAVEEYYLAVFLNQILPGGVLGDASRAWRHARAPDLAPRRGGSAVRAVVLERASGQLVMTAAAVASAAVLLADAGLTFMVVATAVLVALAAAGLTRRSESRGRGAREPSSLLALVGRDARRAVFSGSALPVQLVSSALIVGSYVITFVLAARAVGIDMPAGALIPLVPPVLVSMLLPISVAGWGVREGAAAAVWAAAGLTPADGVAISVAYGVLVLLGTLPGALVLLRGPQEPVAGAAPEERSRSNRTSSPSRN